MLRHNLKNLYQPFGQKTTPMIPKQTLTPHKNTVKTLFLMNNLKKPLVKKPFMNNSSKLRMFIPQTARRLMESRPSGFLNRMIPKRNFNSKIDSLIESGLQNLPQGNIAYLIVALNTLFYAAYCFWPKNSMHTYLNNFTFSLYGLNKGYFWNMFTCHFAH